MHNGGIENISDEQILDGLAILNRDFRKLNPDALTVVSEFQGKPADIEVEFVLATKDPTGACFSGITRTKNSITFDGTDGSLQVDAIVGGNDVYRGLWPGNKYLNVFICEDIGGAAGYTRFPYNSEMENGIWVLQNYVGSIGTSSLNTSRTLTHEVGHWLNLPHLWGLTNDPGVSCGDDYVSDTPVTKGFRNCTLSNTKICNPSIVENIENYMDYSYCNKMFTEGQKTRMRTALNSSVGGRTNLWSNNNLIATGANGATPSLCKADFTVDKTTICVGSKISLTDISYNAATSWNWNTSGGTPSSSTLQNPEIIYNTPGTYSITLTASANGISDTETKTQLIKVLPSPTKLPFYEGFENYSTLNNLPNWSIYDKDGNLPFTLYSGTGYSGQKCVKLSNFNESTSNSMDELSSPNIDLSDLLSTETMTLSFRYAYRKKIAANSETLKLLVTGDCGDNWVTRKTIINTSLSPLESTTSWTPSSISDWTTVHVTSINNTYYKTNFRFKFQFTGNGGNNIYLDDINLYKGSASDALVLGINENFSLLNDVEVYPNPTEGELNIHFSIPSNSDVEMKIQDVSGKIAKTELIKANEGSNLVLLNTNDLAPGLYFLAINVTNYSKVVEFVIK